MPDIDMMYSQTMFLLIVLLWNIKFECAIDNNRIENIVHRFRLLPNQRYYNIFKNCTKP